MSGKRTVYGAQSVEPNQWLKLGWFNWPSGGDNDVVPPGYTLEVTSIVATFYPTGGATVGRGNLDARDGNGTALWYFQAIYVEPLKTVHLPIPGGLQVTENGYVSAGFTDNGPGSISFELHGSLFLAP